MKQKLPFKNNFNFSLLKDKENISQNTTSRNLVKSGTTSSNVNINTFMKNNNNFNFNVTSNQEGNNIKEIDLNCPSCNLLKQTLINKSEECDSFCSKIDALKVEIQLLTDSNKFLLSELSSYTKKEVEKKVKNIEADSLYLKIENLTKTLYLQKKKNESLKQQLRFTSKQLEKFEMDISQAFFQRTNLFKSVASFVDGQDYCETEYPSEANSLKSSFNYNFNPTLEDDRINNSVAYNMKPSDLFKSTTNKPTIRIKEGLGFKNRIEKNGEDRHNQSVSTINSIFENELTDRDYKNLKTSRNEKNPSSRNSNFNLFSNEKNRVNINHIQGTMDNNNPIQFSFKEEEI